MSQVPVDTSQITDNIDTTGVTIWDFVWAIVVVAGSFLVAAIVRRLVLRGLRPFEGIPENYRLLIARAVGWFVIVVGVFWALGILGVDLGPAVLALLLIAAIAFFAGRGLLENFSAGLILQGSPMFEVGDQISTTSGTGTVREVTGRTVVILTPNGEEVHIPNSTVVNGPVTNLTKEGMRRSTVSVGVAYGTELEAARASILEAASSCTLVLNEPTPDAIVTEFGDNAINIDCRFWHDPTIIGGRRATDEVARAIEVALGARGIVIAFPQRTLWWGEGQEPSQR